MCTFDVSTHVYLLSWENVRILRTASVLFFELAKPVYVPFRGKSQNIPCAIFHVLFFYVFPNYSIIIGDTTSKTCAYIASFHSSTKMSLAALSPGRKQP